MYVHGFRLYFTPVTPVLFAFPSRYWFTIGQSGVFSLGGWAPHLQTGFLVSRPTLRTQNIQCLRVRDFHPLSCNFPDASTNTQYPLWPWASPLSLAATQGISVDFFSSGYLDVSLPLVRLVRLSLSPYDDVPFNTPGFPIRISSAHNGFYLLTDAFRRLTRPSSPLTAWASTVYAYSLNLTTHNTSRSRKPAPVK